MKLEHCKIFANLCESITEASTTMNLIAGTPGGEQVVKKLHGSMALAHNLEYQPVQRISWKDLKDSYKGAWVIIIGSNGTGAIKATGGNTGTYKTVASDGGEVQSVDNSRSDATLDFLKNQIGRFQKYYVAKNTGYVPDTQKKRAANKAEPASTTVTQDTIIKKFKPLWERAISAAIADIKGHVSNMVKNDAFDKARSKLGYIETLQNGLDVLQSGGGDTPDFIRSAVNTSVLMAASHHYPDETGDITRGYSRGYTSQSGEGPKKLLSDISAGDTAKLGTVLSFFKRNLISG
jgi:hypothetical protein